jgi:hypothetical protein
MNKTEKHAFWGALGKGLMGAGKQALIAGANYGASSMGVPFQIGKGPAARAGQLAGQAKNMYDMAGNLTGAAGGSGGLLGGMIPFGKSGSVTGSALLDHLAEKVASSGALSHIGPSELADIAAYSAFIGGKLVNPHDHPRLHAALDAAGLLGLGATTAYGLSKGTDSGVPAAKDLLGLGLMGSALYDRYRSH